MNNEHQRTHQKHQGTNKPGEEGHHEVHQENYQLYHGLHHKNPKIDQEHQGNHQQHQGNHQYHKKIGILFFAKKSIFCPKFCFLARK